MTKPTTIPPHLLESREWQAALILLQHTTLSEFFTAAYVDFNRETIDFLAIKRHASTHSQQCLAGLGAHLFNAFDHNMPGEGLFSLDDRNLRWAFLAMMVRYGVNPAEIVRLSGDANG